MTIPRECIECKQVKIIRALNKCAACYERANRRLYPERYAEIERKRSNTQKRQSWIFNHNHKYYADNAETLRQYQRDWRRNNPKRRDEYKRRRRAKVANLPYTLTLEEWQQILECYHYLCAYCGSNEGVIKEHWIPAHLGGGYTKGNIVPSCETCNLRKGIMTGDEFIELLDLQEWELMKMEFEKVCAY